MIEKNVLNTDLTGKVAVVTGASGTLCSRFSIALARAGAKVAMLSRNTENSQPFIDQITAEGGVAKAYACDVLNKAQVNGLNGLEDAVFYLRYAMGADLTEEQWASLIDGNAVKIPYIYDDASSHGNVGYFTFSLTKEGLGASYDQHEAIDACQPGGVPKSENCDAPAETYTLSITYTAYRLGEEGRLQKNVYNGAMGPGTEVGTGNTIPTGYGVVDKDNTHKVHVISGKIEIIKYFEEGLTDPEDRTFTFILHRLEDGDDTSRDVAKTITIPANQTQGSASIVFDGLRRGTYTVTEAADEAYAVKSIQVLDETNCYSVPARGESGTELKFTMGNNTVNNNVIGYEFEGDRYTSYVDPVNGVYGVAAFTNGPKVFEAEIGVEKRWVDPDPLFTGEPVYVALYLSGQPVKDAQGNVRVLRLDQSNNWKGSFTVPLTDENDTLANYDYAVRELSQISETSVPGWHTAILENEGTVIYYEKALEEGDLLHLSSRSYRVEYGSGEEGQLLVTNSRGLDLPKTGGMGTKLYTVSGLVLTMAALLMGFSQRRKREGGQAV